MLRCTECVIPDTRPDTAFVDGVCSACRNFKARRDINWVARGEMLDALVNDLKGRSSPSGFDCIVPSSGGKDSTYQVLKLLTLGLRPLVVTASTCHLTPIGRANIDNLARHATTIEVTPNRSVRAKLNKYGLITLGDISYPEHMAIFSIPFQIAARYGISTIFYGESPQQEYGCPEGAEQALTMTRRWVHEFGGLLGSRAFDCIGYENTTEEDMREYMLPVDLSGITAYFLGQFIPWDSNRNTVASIEAGMKYEKPSNANWWPAENLDNAQTGLHDHMMYRKYGYGRMAAQLSVDIRNGRIDRKTALMLVNDFDGLFPFNYAGVSVDEMLERIGVGLDELMKTMDEFTNWDLFDRVVELRPILKQLDRKAA